MSPLETPPPAAIHQELERILRSDGFSASAQLSKFLRHVVENGLVGQPGQLKESVIGITVFNRGAGYDPKADPIVRVEARRLRTRLEAYYAGPGAGNEVRIQLPKGGYVPNFEVVQITPAPDPIALTPQPATLEPIHPRSQRWRWAVLAAVISLAVIFLATRNTAPARPDIVTRFWGSLLEGKRPAMLVPADSGLVMLQDIVHQPVLLADYLSGEYRMTLAAHSPISPELTRGLSNRRYTSIADLEFTNRLARRKEAVSGVATRFARDVRMEDLKENNLILLGARHSNPWVELFEKEATFRLEHNEQTGVFTLRNTRPLPGEPAEIVVTPAEIRDKIYGIVTYHNNRDGGGKVLVVAGMTVAGTEAASDFLLKDAELRPWLEKASEGGELRPFDILLYARNLSGNAPHAEVIAFHSDR